MSLCAYIEIQFATPAPDDAALKRSVIVISLLTSVPPALHPMHDQPIGIGDALLDQVIDAGHHVGCMFLK